MHCPCPEPNPKGTARFPKAARLRHRQEFLRAQAQGKRFHTRHFGVTLAPMAEGQPRLGLVATRRLGKAVRRNRVKRLLREFFRRHRTTLPAFDLVIMAKKGAAALEYHQVEEELGRLLFSRARQKTHD
ncbi:MAG: ribonuclease P protein component [Syntrophobacterales bacterium RIFOXYC2_FULL_60_23]|nr:MAG: ribonuclease P protein component [Syntrophobacterales bacterium RIFOXYC2_FULL_60_23]